MLLPVSDIGSDRRQRRQTVIAVSLAAFFLAVIGAAVGIIVGSQGDDDPAASPDPVVTSGPAASETPSPTATATATRTVTPRPTRSYPPPALETCPQQTREQVGSDLTVVLAVRTSRSMAWICKDGRGTLYYQGWIRNTAFTAPSSNSTIFLTEVREQTDVYIAQNRTSNGTTMYYVSTSELRIEQGSTVQAREPVERYHRP